MLLTIRHLADHYRKISLGTLQLHSDNWYTKVTDLIEKQQTAPIWMSDTKV